VPIRLFAQELGTLSLVVVFMTMIAWLLYQMLSPKIGAAWAGVPGAFLGAIVLTRVLQASSLARRLALLGFQPDEVLKGLRATVDEPEAQRQQLKADPDTRRRRRKTVIMALIQLPIAILLINLSLNVRFSLGTKAEVVQTEARQPTRATLGNLTMAATGLSLLGVSFLLLARSPFGCPRASVCFASLAGAARSLVRSDLVRRVARARPERPFRVMRERLRMSVQPGAHSAGVAVTPHRRIECVLSRTVSRRSSAGAMEQNHSVIDPRQWYVEQLDVIDRIASSICRRNGVQGADAEDFGADVRLKLLQDDHAVLRKYRGASSPTTFLTVVISNLFRDYRVKHWGKWRPSAEAKRQGASRYCSRQRCIATGKRSIRRALPRERRPPNGGSCALRKLLADLPARVSRRVDDNANVDDVQASESADARVLEHERQGRVQAAKAALGRAIDRSPPEDKQIVRRHFYEGFTVADVARAVGIPQKPLYVRMKRLLEALSKDLQGQGIGPEYHDWDFAPP
jgi:RNA polymerase sigma factor (sigma-70 family)